jgi:quercetin dioxygenase-like cupin family protein
VGLGQQLEIKIASVKFLPIASVLVVLLAAQAFTQSTQLVLENERVRVLRIVLPRHEKASVDWRPPFVTIYLSDAHAKITAANGKVNEVRQKAGNTSYSVIAARIAENVSDQPLEFVVIELKEKPPGAPTYKFPPSTDPAKIDPKFHTVDFENDHVRILRTVLEPHIKSPMHAHPAYVVVYLTDLHTKMTFPDGTVNDNRRKRGDIAWRDALQHSTENVEDQHAEEIQVEMK